MRNPATAEQYRLAQAVLHGTTRFPTHMTAEAARKIIRDTPAAMRSEYSRYSTNPLPKDFGEGWMTKNASDLVKIAVEFGNADPALLISTINRIRPSSDSLVNTATVERALVLMRRQMANPAEESEKVYEKFHGRPSEGEVVVEEEEHYHEHVGELGILKGLKFRCPDGQHDVTLDFEGEEEDEEDEQENPWFGGGGARSLADAAYRLGYMGSPRGQARGKEVLRSWLNQKVREGYDINRSSGRFLLSRYTAGMRKHEAEEHEQGQHAEYERRVAYARAAAQRAYQTTGALPGASSRPSGGTYRGSSAQLQMRGYTITPAAGGGYTVPGLGGKYGSVQAAQKAIVTRTGGAKGGRNPRRKGPFGKARQFLGTMGRGAMQGLDSMFTGNPSDDEGPVYLSANEHMNQLYLVGGDQSIEVEGNEDFWEKHGVDTQRDSIILGELWAIAYTTEKKFDQFEEIEYVHGFGPEKLQAHMPKKDDLWLDARPPKEEAFGCGLLPTLRYDALNDTLHLDGGAYIITEKGIEE